MIDAIIKFLEMFIAIMEDGGLAMWVLFILNLMLWYGLGFRRLILRRKSLNNVRLLIKEHNQGNGGKKGTSILDYVITDALAAASDARAIGKKPRKYIDDALWPYRHDIKKYSVMIKTIVMLAPLIGLLGTVIGMIETFEALQTNVMFSQGDSISGGISKALFTTELGLIVAVPGLILGRMLDRQETQFSLEFEQITDIISIKESERET
jgi:biopolymer transport protein ExbB